MKKSFFLFLASFCFALPAFAQSNTAQTAQTVKTTDTPAQVNVTINNTATAQGNTQTTKVESSQPAAITATASTTNPSAGQNASAGSHSLFGNYASSPYQSNIQVEMLRNSVWNALVPRKRLYDDPATGNSSTRYIGSFGSSGSKYSSKQNSSGKRKSANKQAVTKQNAKAGTQAAGTQTAAGQAINSLTAASQNTLLNLPSGQTVTVVQKDGLLCVPVEQLEQITGQKLVPDTTGSNVFYVPTSPSPVSGSNSGNSAGRANSFTGTSPAVPYQPGIPATAGNPANSAAPAFGANTTAGTTGASPNGMAPAGSADRTNPAMGANPASSVSPAAGANAVQSAAPAGGSVNTPAPERDIFAIPANPFGAVNSSNPASFAGGTQTFAGQNPSGNNISGQSPLGQNPLGQRSLGDNTPGQNPLSQSPSGNTSMTQNPLTSPVPAGANSTPVTSGTSATAGTSSRDISVTAGSSATQNL